MKRKMYNNVLKVGKLIQKKGCEEKEALELADMTYTEFLSNIDKYVGYVVEFKTRFKSNGKIFTSQRYVWDNK